jgi:hypothetical protein
MRSESAIVELSVESRGNNWREQGAAHHPARNAGQRLDPAYGYLRELRCRPPRPLVPFSLRKRRIHSAVVFAGSPWRCAKPSAAIGFGFLTGRGSIIRRHSFSEIFSKITTWPGWRCISRRNRDLTSLGNRRFHMIKISCTVAASKSETWQLMLSSAH